MWASLWTEAVMELKLTEEFFFSITPRQFYWLRERSKQQREHTELMMGITTSTLANHSMVRPKKPYSAHDFMPCKMLESGERKDAAPRRRWTRKGFAQELVALRTQMTHMFRVKPVPKPHVTPTQQ